MSVRADQIKMGRLVDLQRPGIAQSFMVPTKMENQVRGGKPTDLRYTPRATPDGTNWTISVQRPGIAEPLITAKAEQAAIKDIVQGMSNKETPAKVADLKTMVAEANAANKPATGKPTGVAGFFAGLFGSW